jgi:hypothetical protein
MEDGTDATGWLGMFEIAGAEGLPDCEDVVAPAAVDEGPVAFFEPGPLLHPDAITIAANPSAPSCRDRRSHRMKGILFGDRNTRDGTNRRVDRHCVDIWSGSRKQGGEKPPGSRLNRVGRSI